ncbi:hypothetical protein COLU111180_00780 [Cohnella lubricantis]|uniref:DUF559 domain-containing protein n=1 Tax=Cohnella lubricantis TaxID=2163172 RepID=A0A841TKP0_9BACL|nr:hypothetical protein [Cohnella lubricantis]MBB6679758.1 hypothetical protein [Cohnella lubricantis]MBP2119449.1 hypothetical protein [Cohnella lubricantis]
MSKFSSVFEAFLEEQKKSAAGQRLEMLKKDLTGTKKLLEVVAWPALRTLDGVQLEHEFVSSSGVRIYIDAYYEPLRLALECDGYAAHGENLTRDRFSFERMRIRSAALQGYRYFPFSYDELDKKPEMCQRALFELLGRYESPLDSALRTLPVYEREVLRLGWSRNGRPFAEVRECLLIGDDGARSLLRKLVQKELIQPIGSGVQRYHSYKLTDMADNYLL